MDNAAQLNAVADVFEAFRNDERLLPANSTSLYVVYRMTSEWAGVNCLLGKSQFPGGVSADGDWMKVFLLPEDWQIVGPAVQAARSARSKFDLEHRFKKADGSIVWIHSRVIPIINANGAVQQWVGLAVEIQPRAITEAALRRSEAILEGQKQAFQAAMNGQPLSESLAALVQTVVDLYRGAARAAFYTIPPGKEGLYHLVGMTEEYAREIAGFVIGPDSVACGRTMHIGSPVITHDVEADPRWKDFVQMARRHHYRSCWSFPVRTIGGPTLGTLALYFTEPRKPEPEDLELAGIIAHAASIIISRHRETMVREQAEAALLVRENELKHALSLRDEFIGIASHELKTPITTIKAYSQIVLRDLIDREDEVNCTLVRKLNQQVHKLTTLINHLLDTTRIAEGQLMLNPEPFQIDALLREVTGEIQRTTDHQFRLDLQFKESITADPQRISQVITNLLSNAVKYSPFGTAIGVSSKRVGHLVEVSVQDEGYGIPEEDQEKIFDRFYRVPGNNQKTSPGMGLGLYISAQIVQRHGGDIQVQSKRGEGSVFYLTLPAGD